MTTIQDIVYELRKNPNLYKNRQKEKYNKIKEFKKEIREDPQGQEMIKKLIMELKDKNYKLKIKLTETHKNSATCDDKDDWLYNLILEDIKEQIKKNDSKLWRLLNMVQTEENGWKVIGEPEDINIEEIKQIPIRNFLETEPQNMTKEREKYCCPLHDEKTPSFVYYKNTNSWYCFGECQKGGDVIQLYMEMNDCKFYEAIKDLS